MQVPPWPQAGRLGEPHSAVCTRKEGANRPVLAGCEGGECLRHLSCTAVLARPGWDACPCLLEAAVTPPEQGAQPGRGEEPGMAQPSLKAQTCWPCPGGHSPSPDLLSCCSASAPKKQLKAGARKGSPGHFSPSWVQSPSMTCPSMACPPKRGSPPRRGWTRLPGQGLPLRMVSEVAT